MDEFIELKRPEEEKKNEYYYLRKYMVYGVLYNNERRVVELTIKDTEKTWFTATPIEEVMRQLNT